mmetsp:Transcript_102537/g.260466  ORF Transcript_102537/g.260466 Transcript_102537/m.260466 type:complete len:246 (+) Transcript_102537:1136-1873(+)
MRAAETQLICACRRQGVQVGRALAVRRALGVPGRPRGVAQGMRGGFRHVRPEKVWRSSCQEGFERSRSRSGQLVRQGVGPDFPVSARTDEELDLGQDRGVHLGQQGQEVSVGKNEAVGSVLDDEAQVPRRQTKVQCVEHRTHAADGMVAMQVLGAVPHQRPHPVANPNAPALQGTGKLLCLQLVLEEGDRTVALARLRNDEVVRLYARSSVDQRLQQQREGIPGIHPERHGECKTRRDARGLPLT